MDSHLRLVAEAEEGVRKVAYPEGFADGRAAGKEELRAELQIQDDWSLPQEVIDRLMFGDEQVFYTDRAPEQALAQAASWRKGRETLFWRSVEDYCQRQYKVRMQKLRNDPLELHQREVLGFIEGLMSLPDIAARIERKLHEGPDTAPPKIKVVANG